MALNANMSTALTICKALEIVLHCFCRLGKHIAAIVRLFVIGNLVFDELCRTTKLSRSAASWRALTCFVVWNRRVERLV